MNHIKIWRFEDAPKEYQELSTNGGDEDWVIVTPKSDEGLVEMSLLISERLAVCDYDRYEKGAEVISITNHA